MDRDFDIIVFGATGFTGALVAEHLLSVYGATGDIRWGLGGRNPAKLEEVRERIGAPESVPIVVADSSDPDTLISMARRTKVVASLVGPYQLYGGGVVAACAAEGTDYVDISGESHWIRDMLVHEAAARESGARIVFSCGFDSVPFELGVYFLQETAKARFGSAVPRVRARVRRLNRGIRGRMSGGSVATSRVLMETMQKNPQIAKIFADPFALTPGFVGPDQPPGGQPYEDTVAGSWVGPFVMAPINTKAVHRANFLMGHPWGKDFRYDEMVIIAGPPDSGPAAPMPQSESLPLPKPGEGPSKADREGGCYDVLFIGETADGQTLRVSLISDSDPGGGSTARMLGESAVCLVRDISREQVRGGMWTSASAMADALIERLEATAGITFKVES